MEQLSEAGDDEERVVDPDPEPDHRYEDRRDGVDVGLPGEDEEEKERRHERDDRERDRDQHRDERAEDEEQHDDRREQAERLGEALLERGELGLAVEFNRHAGRLDRLTNGVLDCDDLRPVLVLDRLVELGLSVGDTPVFRNRRRVERVADAREPGLPVDRLELGRLQSRHSGVDRGLSLRRVEPLTLGGGEDDVEDGALLGGELGLDQVRRLLRVGAGDRELVTQGAADRRDEHDQDGNDPDPRDDDAPRMRGACAHPASKRARCRALVGGKPALRGRLWRGRALL